MLDILTLLLPLCAVVFFGARVPAFCRSHGLVVDIVDGRHAHKTPTPHGGGIVLVAVILPLALLSILMFPLPHKPFLTALFLASGALAFLGWCDDKAHIPAQIRLLGHLVAVGVGLYFMPQLFDIMPLWAEKILLLLAWGWFVNLYNFMDGLDGLATSQAVFLALAIALLVVPYKPIALIIAGACLGFLRINWHPAKVFLGDVGSTFLGYILGGLLLISLADNTWDLAWPLFTLPLVFTFDATYTLIKRIVNGHSPSKPHREFFIHRAAVYGYTHPQIVRRVIIINLMLFIIVATGMHYTWQWLTFIAGLALVGGVAFFFNHLERTTQNKGKMHG